MTKPVEEFATFPKEVYTVLTSPELRGMPRTYTKRDPSFKEVNNLDYDLYGLNAFYNPETPDQWEIRLFNFRNDSVIYKWELKKSLFDMENFTKFFKNTEIRNCILLPDHSIIVAFDQSFNLLRIDKNSKVMWRNQDQMYHHSLNLDDDSNIWACTSFSRSFKNDYMDNKRPMRDDHITQINLETGETIFDKSVIDILLENGYENLAFGYANSIKSGYDPIHLNDIQPALSSTQYWKKGDLFISLKHRSAILLYRPSTNNIIRIISGPFLNQHDVDIISNHQIAFFNNNALTIGLNTDFEELYLDPLGKGGPMDSIENSQILVYNFQDSTYHEYLKHNFNKEHIFSQTEGLFEILSNGDTYVESQNDGKMYIMNEDKIILKKYFKTSKKNWVERPNWIRIYENIRKKDFQKRI